jgi:hypothetical protein
LADAQQRDSETGAGIGEPEAQVGQARGRPRGLGSQRQGERGGFLGPRQTEALIKQRRRPKGWGHASMGRFGVIRGDEDGDERLVEEAAIPREAELHEFSCVTPRWCQRPTSASGKSSRWASRPAWRLAARTLSY